MAMPEQALDIPEAQVAINFDQDQNYTWHARLLVLKLPAGASWISVTPDLEIEVLDLALHTVVVLPRAARFPDRVRGDIYARAALSDAQREGVLHVAWALVEILGAAPGIRPTGVVAYFRIVDIAYETFGEVVVGHIVRDPAGCLLHGPVVLVGADADAEQFWPVVDRAPPAALDAWLDE